MLTIQFKQKNWSDNLSDQFTYYIMFNYLEYPCLISRQPIRLKVEVDGHFLIPPNEPFWELSEKLGTGAVWKQFSGNESAPGDFC